MFAKLKKAEFVTIMETLKENRCRVESDDETIKIFDGDEQVFEALYNDAGMLACKYTDTDRITWSRTDGLKPVIAIPADNAAFDRLLALAVSAGGDGNKDLVDELSDLVYDVSNESIIASLPGDLGPRDDAMLDEADVRASNVNNTGISGQLEFLLANDIGEDEIEKIIVGCTK